MSVMPIEPPNHLPRPNPAEVEEFKQLFLKHKGVLLSDEEAGDPSLASLYPLTIMICFKVY